MTILFDYTLIPRSRISAGRTAEVVNNRAIHEVIPGSVVRGALGAAWWGNAGRFTGPDPQATFDRAFARALRIGPAVPSRGEEPARLIALTAVKCKYPKDGGTCLSEWVDTEAYTEPLGSCPCCGGALEHGRGWELGKSDRDRPWVASTTRTALGGKEGEEKEGEEKVDEEKEGVARDGQLFTRKALRKDLLLHGQIRLADDELGPDAMGLVSDWLTSDRSLSVGGQRSTLGRCTWHCAVTDEPPLPLDPIGYAVRLTSPALLLDDWGTPTLDLNGAVQQAITDACGNGTVSARRAIRPVTVSGWHGMAGLPKPEEWGVAAGSVAIVHEADEVTVRALADGIGIRRVEGYGTVKLVGLSTLPTSLDSAVCISRGRAPGGQFDEDQGAQRTDKQQVVTVGPIEAVLTLAPDRRALIQGMLAHARLINSRRRSGASVATIRPYVEGLKNLPWMRDLAGQTQDAVIELWLSDDLADHIATLEHLKDGGS